MEPMQSQQSHLEDLRRRIRHSAAHVMAEAVTELFPDALPTIGPPTDDGFYYDFAIPAPFTDEDLKRITKRMARSIKANTAFVEREVSRDEALAQVSANPYKVEILEGIPDGERVTLVSHSDGKFTDLCRGMHVEKTGDVAAFKLLKVAGAYWRGDEKRPMLQRIYGTAWESEEALSKHVEMLEEAAKRDHRKFGRELGLFFFDAHAPGSPFFLPGGAFVMGALTEYMRGLYAKYGYSEVITPQIFDAELWKRSGHYDNYAEDMYFIEDDGGQKGVKPMNCPAAALIFASEVRSYRNLPLRFADFGRLHRNERSGVTHGLTRVRSFSQDDAHIFCSEDQIADEIRACLAMLTETYSPFGFSQPEVALSLRPSKRVGDDAIWDKAERVLEECLQEWNVPYSRASGEGAFYGPKIDVSIPDALGRKWQLGTIQADFSLPARFDLTYVAQNGSHLRPVVIHRALLGSLERFLGVLLEHLNGRLPLWLAPVQVSIIPITDRHNEYAREVKEFLAAANLRVAVDSDRIRMNAKIRNARLRCIPYTLIVGDNEANDKTVSARSLSLGDLGSKSIAEVKAKLLEKTAAKSLNFDW